jgi:hypothetical protein
MYTGWSCLSGSIACFSGNAVSGYLAPFVVPKPVLVMQSIMNAANF